MKINPERIVELIKACEAKQEPIFLNQEAIETGLMLGEAFRDIYQLDSTIKNMKYRIEQVLLQLNNVRELPTVASCIEELESIVKEE